MTDRTTPGHVFWLTGLSGVGKTTIGKRFYSELKQRNLAAVFLDGDDLRSVFGGNRSHDLEDRKECAMTYARLCRLLSEQETHVVCSTISMFHDVRLWNQENICNYKEIYLRAPIGILKERDSKGIYSRAEKGELTDVMGVDLPFEEPDNPNLIIDNDGSRSVDEIVEILLSTFHDFGFSDREGKQFVPPQ